MYVGDHLKVIRRNITDLLRMDGTLAKTAARYEGGSPHLSIIDASEQRIAAQ
jgi:hypothetical protein